MGWSVAKFLTIRLAAHIESFPMQYTKKTPSCREPEIAQIDSKCRVDQTSPSKGPRKPVG
jgi:hypothetical protein